ncbi:MAG: type VI secretion system baseplate subunit TssG [Gammaproteobacteria bacterium]
MAGTSRRTADSLADQLFREPYRFDFFQAVRILEALGRERSAADRSAARMAVGHDFAPGQETVRFRALPSRSFPASTISALAHGTGQGDEPTLAPEMTVSFMGLVGPGGVLPEHYTDLLLRRLRLKDHALRDFLDLFNHRTISLFYRAWLKYRFPFNHKQPGDEEDAFALALKCLTGMGSEHMAERTIAADETFLFYSGRMANRVRPAEGLAKLLSDCFGVPVSVEQFQGHWLTVEDEERTVLPSGPVRSGYYNRLGVDSILGDRVWDVQSRFRLRIGPLGRKAFAALLPTGETLAELCAVTRTYVGPELDYDVQLVLAGEEVPPCRLQGGGMEGAALGWSSWLAGGRDGDAGDACFQPEIHAGHSETDSVSST